MVGRPFNICHFVHLAVASSKSLKGLVLPHVSWTAPSVGFAALEAQNCRTDGILFGKHGSKEFVDVRIRRIAGERETPVEGLQLIVRSSESLLY